MKTQFITVTKEHWRQARKSYKENTKATMMHCPLELAMKEAKFIMPTVSLFTFRYYTQVAEAVIKDNVVSMLTIAESGILGKGALLLRRLFDQKARMPKLPKEISVNLCTAEEMKAFTEHQLGEQVKGAS